MDRAISPVERLMREHSALRRLLLIYEQSGAKTETRAGLRTNTSTAMRTGTRTRIGTDMRTDTLSSHRDEVWAETAELIQKFAEEYHQTLEEEYVFPVLLQRNIEITLVQTLLRQHHAARCVTSRIRQLLGDGLLRDEQNRMQFETYLQQYITLYTSHAAWEDTCLFPLFRDAVSDAQWTAVSEQFEAAEERRFGPSGFAGILQRITLLEKAISVHDLERYTPDCETMPTAIPKHGTLPIAASEHTKRKSKAKEKNKN